MPKPLEVMELTLVLLMLINLMGGLILGANRKMLMEITSLEGKRSLTETGSKLMPLGLLRERALL